MPKKPTPRKQFAIDHVPPALFAAVHAKAKKEGVSVRGLVLGWLKAWVKIASVLLVVVLCAACQSAATMMPTSPTPPTTSTLTPAALRLTASSRSDESLTIAVTVLTTDGQIVPNQPVLFAIGAGSITPAMVTTDSTGIAHAIATSPTATQITATAGTLSAQLSILATISSSPSGSPTPPPPPPARPSTLGVGISCLPTVPVHGSAASCAVGVAYNGIPLDAPTITDVTWAWGDGSTDVAHGTPFASHVYSVPGLYAIHVTVMATTVDGPKTADRVLSVTVL